MAEDKEQRLFLGYTRREWVYIAAALTIAVFNIVYVLPPLVVRDWKAIQEFWSR